MGLFDSVFGKKGKDEQTVLEPRDGGYVLKGHRAKAPGVSRACAFFCAAAPMEEEPELLMSLVGELRLKEKLNPDALITTDYGSVPDIDEFLSTREMPESLNAFIMARAMLTGLARSQAEMGRLAVEPFEVKGVKGVLVLKEA